MFCTWCDVLHRKSSLGYQVPLGASTLLSGLSCLCDRSVSVFLSPVLVRLDENIHCCFLWPLWAKIDPSTFAFLDTLNHVHCSSRLDTVRKRSLYSKEEKFKKITLAQFKVMMQQCPEGSLGGEELVSGPSGEQNKSALSKWVPTLALAPVHLAAQIERISQWFCLCSKDLSCNSLLGNSL